MLEFLGVVAGIFALFTAIIIIICMGAILIPSALIVGELLSFWVEKKFRGSKNVY